MTKITFILIYDPSDSEKAKEVAETLKREEGINVSMPFSQIVEEAFDNDVFEQKCVPIIDDANFLLFLVSDNSRNSSICLHSIKYASNLNKRILVARCDKGGFFQNWIKKEWNFRDEVYSWLDEDSRADLTAILREWTGCEIVNGDRIGAKVTFNSTNSSSKFFLYKEENSQWKDFYSSSYNKKDVLSLDDDATEDVSLRLGKGKYKVHYQSTIYPKRVNIYHELNVKTNSSHQELTFDIVKEVLKHREYVNEQEEKRIHFLTKFRDTSSEMISNYDKIHSHLLRLQNLSMHKPAFPFIPIMVISTLVSLFFWFNIKSKLYSPILFDYIEKIAYHSENFILTFVLTTLCFFLFFWILYKVITICCDLTFCSITNFRISYNEWKLEPAKQNKKYYSNLYNSICLLGKFTPMYFENFDGKPDDVLCKLVKEYGKGKKVYHRNPLNALSHLPKTAIYLLWISCIFWSIIIYICWYLLIR